MKKFTFTMLLVFLVAFGVNAQFSKETQGSKPYHAPKKGLISNVSQAKGPLAENFEGTFPPSSWALTAGGGDWEQSTDVDHTTGTGNSAIYDCYNTSGTAPAYMTTPEMTVAAGDATFTFWCNYYLIEGAYGSTDKLYIDKSTDGGTTWTAGTTNYLSTIIKSTWTQFTVDLTANIGQNVTLRFKAISAYGSYNIAIDDVAGPTLATYPFDAGVISINGIQNIYRGATTSATIPSATVKNFGTNEASFDVTFTAGTFTSTKNVVSLAAGATTNVTFDPWTPIAGVNNTTVTTTLVSDAVASNNTKSKAVFNYIYSLTDGLKWDNGPFITNVGAGSTGKDVSVIANGSYGFNYKNTVAAVADEFDVPIGETWVVDKLINYGYQTNSPITSTFTNTYFKIWNGNPSSGTATVLYDYSATNQQTATTFSNVYRTISTDMATATTRPIMENTCNLATKFKLMSGKYWIQWSATGSLASGPWALPITTTGMVLGDNSLTYDVATTTWAAAAEEIAFKIYAHDASTATQISAFNLTTPAATGVVNPTAYTVALTVPFGTDVTALVPTFTLSTGATAKVATLAQVSGTTANDFTTPVTYTVTAEDGITTQAWVVTVSITPGSSAKDILTYTIPVQVGTSTIDPVAHTVALTVPFGTDVTALVPTFTLSPLATAKVGAVSQVSGTTANDFTAAVTYTVTAQDATTQDWTVTVSIVAGSPLKEILTYAIPVQVGTSTIDPVAHTVALAVPFGTDVTALVSTFTLSSNASATVGVVSQVSETTANNFTAPVVYTVTAQDATTQDWTVTVSIVAGSPLKEILAYAIPVQVGTSTIDPVAHTVAVAVPFGTDLTALVSTFTLSPNATAKVGAVAQVSGTTANDFTAAVTYTVTAQDATTQDWTVTISLVAGSPLKEILTYAIPAQIGTSTIDLVAHTVALTVPFGTDVTALVSTFTLSSNASATVGAVAQVSGTTANNFTAPVVYTVTAQDETTQAWTVTVTIAAGSPLKEILTYAIPAQIGTSTIDLVAHTVALTVPFGTDVTALVSTFTLSPNATAKVGAVAQVSGTTANDFTAAVTYTVTAQDATTQDWTVTVSIVAGSSAKDVLTYSISTQVGTSVIDAVAHTVALAVPFGTDVTALVSTFTLSSNATAKVGAVAQVSGTTANNFTAPVVYTVTAQDATTQDWTVTVSIVAGSSAKDILTFGFAGLTPAVTGTVDGTAHTVVLTVPFGTDVTALVSTFTLSTGATAKVATLAQVSGTTANDFTTPVTYTVTAEDGITTQAWVVTVSITAGSSAKDILTFGFAGLTPAVTGTVDGTAHTVVLTVPFGTNVTALVPTFTLSPLASAKVGAVAQVSGTTANNFTAPVVYTVTAQDATTQDWTVTVSVATVQTYTVTYNVVGTNGSLAATVDAVAVTSPATVETGKNVVFTATPAATYVVKEWKLNGTVVTGNTTNTYTLSNVVANATVTVEFKLSVGVDEATANVVSIYPNPANTVVNVKMNTTISKIEVVNINGQVVTESVLNSNEASINVSSLANGMYFLRIQTENGITMNKIQIVK